MPNAISTTWIRKARLRTAPATANPLSRPLTPEPIGADIGRGMEEPGGADAGALGIFGAAAGPAGPEGDLTATGAAGAAAEAGAGDGSRTVGAAVGFGGRAIRTVSFLGWTLAASPGVGGTGVLGRFSDISWVRS